MSNVQYKNKIMIELYNGDCLELMQSLLNKKVDCIITDIPYGTTSCQWDEIIPLDKMWNILKQIRKNDNVPILLFGNEPFSSKLRLSNIEEYKYDIYWQKERITNIFQVKKRPGKIIENISVFYKKQCFYNPQMTKHEGQPVKNKPKGKIGNLIDSGNKYVFAYQDNGNRYPLQIIKFNRDVLKSNLHPTQKPLALMEYLIKTFSKENDIVLDFTMGSGTTGLACKNLNRNFIGIEKDKEYFEIAKNRINN